MGKSPLPSTGAKEGNLFSAVLPSKNPIQVPKVFVMMSLISVARNVKIWRISINIEIHRPNPAVFMKEFMLLHKIGRKNPRGRNRMTFRRVVSHAVNIYKKGTKLYRGLKR